MAVGDFASIGGVAVKFIRFRRLEDETSGEPERTLSGQRRGDPLWTARGWEGDAICLTDEEADALHAVADNRSARLCVGSAFPPGGVLCQVKAGSDEYEPVQGGWYRVVALTFFEELAVA